MGWNRAETERFWPMTVGMVTWQIPVPVQLPDQRPCTEPGAGIAVSVTAVPGSILRMRRRRMKASGSVIVVSSPPSWTRRLTMCVTAPREVTLTPEVAANVARIDAIWTDCRTRYGGDGAFLFGAFGAADAMYAPVVSRFHTYAVEVGAVAGAYMEAVMALPAWREWRAAALVEPWVLPEDEVDWPTVMRV